MTAGERLRIVDLDAACPTMLQDHLREQNGVVGGAVRGDRAGLDLVVPAKASYPPRAGRAACLLGCPACVR